jgi:hypothetical protein
MMARFVSLLLAGAVLIAGCAPAAMTGSAPSRVAVMSAVEVAAAPPQLQSAPFVEQLQAAQVDSEIDSAAAELLPEDVLAEELQAVDLLAEELPAELELAAFEPVAAKTFAEPTRIPYQSFYLPIPFRSQKDGSRYQGSNCGPAALAMVFQAYGMVYDNDHLRWLSHTYQGTVGRRGGTALQHMARVADDYGMETVGLYDGASFHRWTVAEIREQLQAGRVVIPLVKYRLLPGHEASTIRFDHYIVIHGIQGDRFLYHDPAYEFAIEGASRWITAAQLDAAIAPALEPRQAVAIGPGNLSELSAIPI